MSKKRLKINMTETPKTDRAEFCILDCRGETHDVVGRAFARELERENARLVNQIDNLRKCGTAVRNALSYSERSWPNDQTKIREWDMLVGLRPDFPSV